LGVQTTLVYRRSPDEMPAKDEIHEAQEEGVDLQFLMNPVKIEQAENGLSVTCVKMILSEPDERGRRRPVPLEGSEIAIEVDSVVMAIGQTVDPTLMSQKGAGIFFSGDCVAGPDLVVTAVASGRKVAASIHQFLMNEPVVGEKIIFSSQCGSLDTLPDEMFSVFPRVQRMEIPTPSIDVRRKTFDDIEGSVTKDEMTKEAERCLSCGCIVAETCDLRKESAVSEAAQSLSGDHRAYKKDASHPVITLETDKCIQCGACVRVCDELKKFHSLGFVGRGFSSRIEPQLGKSLAESNCDGCGQCVEVCPTAGVRCFGQLGLIKTS
jgi:ferredoxin